MPTPYDLHVCRPIGGLLMWLAPAYLTAVSGEGVYAWMYANAHLACLWCDGVPLPPKVPVSDRQSL